MSDHESQSHAGDEQTSEGHPTDNVKSSSKNRFIQSLQGDGLRSKALRGTAWTVAGFGISQVLRLGSNLILTRLLFPEDFGLMALATVFMQGLNMLSDIGVGPSIIQNKRGDDPDFLATAWTMQIIRGFVLWLGMCLLAYPVSLLYEESLLFPILMLIGLSSMIASFRSIGISTASRKMALGRLTLLELISQVVGIITLVIWAWITHDVWALVGGGVVASVIRVVLGHRMLPSDGNRFLLERAAAKDIFHFGKWIFIATTFTYFGEQGLLLFHGYLIPLDTLGLISIAGMLGMIAITLTHKLGASIILPTLSHINLNQPEELPNRLRETRTKLFLLTCPIFVILILFGQDLIYLMYDDRYHGAGLFLVIFATSSAIASQRTPFGMVLIATGDVYGHAVIKAVTAFARMSAIFVGFSINGVIGMLLADIVAQAVIYPFEAWRLKKQGLWLPVFDLTVFAGYLALGAISYSTGPYFLSP